jgi:hypothetical protein
MGGIKLYEEVLQIREGNFPRIPPCFLIRVACFQNRFRTRFWKQRTQIGGRNSYNPLRKSSPMIVTVWANGSGAYGIRVDKPDVRKHFPRFRREVQILVEDEVHVYLLSQTFWTSCPKLRGGRIGKWLIEENLTSRSRGKPTKLELRSLGEGRFRREKVELLR